MRGLIRTACAISMAFSWPLHSYATPNMAFLSAQEIRNECSYELPSMKSCLEKRLLESERGLKEAEVGAAAQLDQWDEDLKFIQHAKEKLLAASEEFSKYREAHCAFAASLGGGAIGNALEVQRLACLIELNSLRALQLRNAVSGLPLK